MAAQAPATQTAQYAAVPPPAGPQQAAWQHSQPAYYDSNYYAAYYQHYSQPPGAHAQYNPHYYQQYYQHAAPPAQPAATSVGAPPPGAAPPPGNPPSSSAPPATSAPYDYNAAYYHHYYSHYNYYQQQAQAPRPMVSAGYTAPTQAPLPAAQPPASQPSSYAAAVSGYPAKPVSAMVPPPAVYQPPAASPRPVKAPPAGIVVRPQMSKTAVAAAKVAAELSSKAQQAAATKSVPAYIQVAQAGVGAQKPVAAPPQKGWPPSLSNYVQRSFARCKSVQDRKSIEKPLQDVIKQAESAGELWTRNWDTFPLPMVGMMENSSQSKESPSPSPKSNNNAKKNKRKWQRQVMQEDSDESDESDPYAKAKKMQRAQRFGAGHALGAVPDSKPMANKRSMKQRLQPAGFYSGGAGIVTKAHLTLGPTEEIDWTAHTVVGTCQSLEKSYFRLTCAPDPSTVRPEVVLRKALERLLRILADGSENYFYCQDQFKAMRQDCTVQHIRNAFTAELYEAHARAALDYGEMGDYIQCQTKLNDLYADGIPGSKDEFMAYYTLHLVAHSQLGGEDGALQRTALMNWLRNMTAAERSGPAVAHALKVRAATAMDNNVAFFQLKACAPNLGARIMALQEEQMRFNATTVLTRSFKPTLSIFVVTRMLGFELPGSHREEETSIQSVAQCIEWLKLHGAVLKDEDQGPSAVRLDCKESAEFLYIPEKEDACAHGDANLAVDDFMKRIRAD